MANKLAGQRAKFSRARAIYYTATDDASRERALALMAEVLRDAPRLGFTEDEVTQQEEAPAEARRLAGADSPISEPEDASEGTGGFVDSHTLRRIGDGSQSVYVYGYACAPDRLKVGSAVGDPLSRITAQISTGTPDRPVALLIIQTHDCRALERVIHGVLRLRGKQVVGAGSEWFLTSVDEIEMIAKQIGSA